MPQKAFYIGPYQSGLINAVKPFVLPEDAFEVMENAYVWRGRVKKRVGSSLISVAGIDPQYEHLYSRLRIALTGGVGVGVTDPITGNAAGTVPGTTFALGQMFSIGNVMYTVTTAGVAQPMLQTVVTTTATYSTTNGAYNFVGAPVNTQIYWYPAQPVMGIVQYERVNISDEITVAFDMQFAYYRTGNAWERLLTGAGVDPVWTGTDSQFFWHCNYRGSANYNYLLFVVNYNQPDGIWYWDGTSWTVMRPQTSSLGVNYVLHSARMVFNFKNRLVALNTIEQVGGATSYTFTNRARWSQNGSPIPGAPDADAWYENVPGKGSYSEAATKEAIVSARILKDRLIVYFERSTWELVYTGNHVQPFVWQTIDDQLGAESTRSAVLMDKVVYGVGSTGIHQCDGLRVIRIDDKIPQEIFKIHNDNNGVDRVSGIHDFSNEMIYWAYPTARTNPTYPNKMIVYNYKNDSWSFNDDAITAFGYFQNTDDLTWGACQYTWEEFDRLWNSGYNQSLNKSVLAGNQEGFTFIMDAAKNSNAPALQITDLVYAGTPAFISMRVQNHNLQIGDWILIQFVQGVTNVNNMIFKVIATDPTFSEHIFSVEQHPGLAPTGTYTGGGLISRVSKIDIKTKEFNFYQDAYQMAINKLSFDVDRSASGSLTVNMYTDSNETSLTQEALVNGTAVGTYTLDTYPYATQPRDANRKRLTRYVYIQAEGDCVQLQFTFSDDQMTDVSNMLSAFELNSMTFYATQTRPR